MKGGSPRLTGNLGIAVDETLLQYRLVNVINNFRQMAPDVTIKVELGTAYSIKDMVLRSDFSQVCERSSQWCELRYSQVQTAH